MTVSEFIVYICLGNTYLLAFLCGTFDLANKTDWTD